jgi:hypothetical protein
MAGRKMADREQSGYLWHVSIQVTNLDTDGQYRRMSVDRKDRKSISSVYTD